MTTKIKQTKKDATTGETKFKVGDNLIVKFNNPMRPILDDGYKTGDTAVIRGDTPMWGHEAYQVEMFDKFPQVVPAERMEDIFSLAPKTKEEA